MESALLVLSTLNVTVCKTEECNDVATLILSGMNTTVDPCENFYEYVCGSWSTVCPPTEKLEICSIDSEIEEAILYGLREILEQRPRKKDSVALSMERKWYKACMNQDRQRKKGYKPIRPYFEKIGGWPMIMKPTEWKEIPWQKVAQYYAQLSGKYSLFTITQALNPNSTENKILMFDQLDCVQLDYSYYKKGKQPENNYFDSYDSSRYFNDYGNSFNKRFDKRFKDRYENSNENAYDDDYDSSYDDYDDDKEYMRIIIEDYAKPVGGYVDNLSDYIDEIFEFEEALHNISDEVINYRLDREEIVMTIDEFQKFYDSCEPGDSTGKIDWLEMIHTLTANSGIQIDGSEPILLFSKSYFENLVSLLKNTPNRIIVNFIHTVFFTDSLMYLDKNNRPWDMSPWEEEDDRWEFCIIHMMGLFFDTGFTQVFIDRHFSDDTQKYATEIAEEVREQVELDISTSDWLDSDAKESVKEKLKAMKFHIGFPDYFKNRTFLDLVYDGLKVGPDYYENVMNMLSFDHEQFWREFREPFDKDQFLISPAIVNAFYQESDNSLTIPAAELLVPLFDPSMPLSIKYGYLGFTVGHEINHGFDDAGRKFNKYGNRQPWLAEDQMDKYGNNTTCFVGQFDDYGINGTLTQNENIADTAGLNSAFEAYRKRMKEGNLKDVRLPGLSGLNGDQLFFVSFAASFCASATPELEEYWLNYNEHSIEPHRVNGAVSNVKGFSKAFQCSPNSPMNPDKKCFLWK